MDLVVNPVEDARDTKEKGGTKRLEVLDEEEGVLKRGQGREGEWILVGPHARIQWSSQTRRRW